MSAEEGAVRSTKRLSRSCRVCGCTQDMACMTPEGPCYWVEYDLCSACISKKTKKDGGL